MTSFRSHAAIARRRLRTRVLAIAQTAVAALAAWWLATLLVPDTRPAFASIAAIISLGATHGEHRRRAAQLAGGVVLGLSLSAVIVSLIGTGAPQIALMVMLAMSLAVLLGGGELLITEAAVSAVLLLALDPLSGAGFSPNRIFEALIGGGVALAVGALLFPPDPVLHVGRAAQALFAELGRTLELLAAALASGDTGRAERALLQARSIDALVDELDAALAIGRETARTAPQRFAAREQVERYDRSLAQLDLAVRNTRVLARHSLRAVREGRQAPAELTSAVSELAQAVWALAGAYDEPFRAAAARGLAASAAARTAGVDGHADVAVQVRSTAVDLMRAAEQVQGAPEEQPTEELLALPVAVAA
jgi:uncharacterized membrane protein YgaE (UPF0421/DUF939 family)